MESSIAHGASDAALAEQDKGPGLRRALFSSGLFVAFAFAPPVLAQAGDAVARPRAIAAEAPFLNENEAAMTKMMNDMSAKPTGDADRDFVAMMVPHHQGAIDM